MKAITKYVSDDGREFTDEAKCVAYEVLCAKVAAIMSKLDPIPDLPSCGFANGGGYLQHDPVIAAEARIALLVLANEVMPHRWFAETIANPDADSSWASRMIGEMSEPCLWKAWSRFGCMTKGFREYGQPYFRLNPSEAKNICLNGAHS